MTRTNRLCAAALVSFTVILGGAGEAAGSARAGIPSNPCTLKLAPQLKALRLSPVCSHRKPATGTFGRSSTGTWGARPHVLGVGFFAFSSRAKQRLFEKSLVTIGTRVTSVGSDAVEAVTPLGVAFAGIIDGIGVNLSVNEPSASSTTKRKDAKTVLRLVRALTKQVRR